MARNFTLQATLRQDVGKGASRRLRHANQVPAIIYGAEQESQPITLPHKAVAKALEEEAIYSHILTLDIDGKSEKVVLKDLQRHPFKPQITHMDFQRISDNEKLTMLVPLHFIGAEIAPGVKMDGGIVTHLITEVEVRCLPKDLPEYFNVDISQLRLNQSLHLSDLPIPEGVELVAMAHGENKPVVTIYIPRSVVETPTTATAAATTETTTTTSAEAAGKTAAAAGADKGKEKGKGDKDKSDKKSK